MNLNGFVPSLPAASARPHPTLLTRAPPTLSHAALSSNAAVLPARSAAAVSAPALLSEPLLQHAATGRPGDGAMGASRRTVIVLYRSDLRLDDHPALSFAVEDAVTVVPVYCFDPRHFGRTEYGFEKTGRYRAKFLLESVADLRRGLREKGSDLLVRLGAPEDVVPLLCKKLGAKSVFVHGEVTYEEQNVEHDLADALKPNGVELRVFWANTLYHADDLPFDIEAMPDVYSDFRETVEQKGTIRAPLSAPETMPRLPAGVPVGDIPTMRALGITEELTDEHPVHTASGVSAVTGGESEAMRRVEAYVERARKADVNNAPSAQVNAHLGADFSCRISPWLALGCISPRRIFDEMKKTSANPTGVLRSTTYYELVWRDFFRCITAKYSSKRSAAVRNVAPRRKAAVAI